MSSNRFKFLEVAWIELYEMMVKIEKNIQEGSFSVYKNLKTFTLMLARNILVIEDKGYEKGEEIEVLKDCTYVDEKTYQLFKEIIELDCEEFQDIYVDEIMKELLRSVAWLTFNYSSYDYNKYDFSYLEYEDINMMYDLLLNRNLLKDEVVREGEKVKEIQNPFEIIGFQELIDEKIRDFSLLDKDVFETYEEYCDRIASMEAREFGEIYIEMNKYDECTSTLPVVGTVFNLDGINKFKSDIFYIKSDNIKFKIKQDKIQIPLMGKLCVYKNEIYMNINELYACVHDRIEKVEALVLYKLPYEDEACFYKRIDNMPDLKIGKAKLLRDRYVIENEDMPCKIAFYKWVEDLEMELGHLKINRIEAKNICEESLMYDVYGKFIGIGNESYIHKLSLKLKSGEFKIENSKLKEIERSKKEDEYIRNLFKSAEEGNADSMNEIGEIYLDGKKATQDYEKAMVWFKKAAEIGNGNAMNNIGEMHYYGYGVVKNLNEAVKWYYIGAELGNANSLYNLGNMYEYGEGVEQNYDEAIKWYKQSAEKGNAYAQYNLGDIYECGQGVKQDYEEAVKWYTLAAEQGDSDAQVDLGNMYFYGQGVEKNYSEAIKWYKKSAEQGNVNAQYNLADMYFYGKGVERNYEESDKWNKLAKENEEKSKENNKRKKNILSNIDGNKKISKIYDKVKENGIIKNLKSNVLNKFLN